MINRWFRTAVLAVAITGGWPVITSANNQPEVERDPDYLAGRAALNDAFYDVAALRFESYVNKTASKRRKAFGAIFLLRSWHGMGEYQRMLDWLRVNSEITRGTRYEGASVFWQAQAKLSLGLPGEALAMVKDFEKQFPADEFLPYVIRLRAQALRNTRKLEEAEALFRQFDTDYAGREEIPDNLLDWAGVLVQLKRVREAEVIMRRVTEEFSAYPAASFARLWMGQAAIENKNPEEALLWLTAVATNELADRMVRADAWFALARSAVDENRITNALDALQQGERFTTNTERKVESRIDQARLLTAQNRLNEAMEMMNQTVVTLATRPQAARALLELSDMLRAQGRLEQAVDAYQRYIESFSETAGLRHALYSKAWCLWELKRYAEAALTFEKAYGVLRNQVLREQALVKTADSYFMNNQYRLAATTYERALKEFPVSAARPEVMYQAGESYARAGDVTNTVGMFRQIADLPGDGELPATAMMRLARFHEESRAWEDAIALYNEVMVRFSSGPRYPAALLGRALLKYRLARYAEAQGDFERLLAEFPGTSWAEQATFMRAWCAYQLGQQDRAIALAEEFLKSYPQSAWRAEVSFWLAEDTFNRQQFGVAETNFAAIANADPTNALAPQALFWAGRSAVQSKSYRRAIDLYFDPLILRYPQSPLVPETRFAQGDALTEIGDFAGAILAFNEIVTRYPDHPLVIRALGRIGDCQFTLGTDRPERLREALESYRTLLSRPQITPDLAVQAEYKLGRTCERLGFIQDATTHYLNVVYGWLAARASGQPVDEVWFVRSAFGAAAIKEASEEWSEAIRIYQQVVDSGLTAAADATIRIDRIKNQRQIGDSQSVANPTRTR